MPTWKAGGYVIRLYRHDHPPLHVNVFRDGRQVAKYDLQDRCFPWLADERQTARIKRALGQVGLIARSGRRE